MTRKLLNMPKKGPAIFLCSIQLEKRERLWVFWQYVGLPVQLGTLVLAVISPWYVVGLLR